VRGEIVRKWLGRLTSPFFVPLRRLVVWGDKTFGTCDMKLTLEPRYQDHPLRGFAEIDESSIERLSELQIKLSKDKANIEGLGESE
jgi:hypothetical protein